MKEIYIIIIVTLLIIIFANKHVESFKLDKILYEPTPESPENIKFNYEVGLEDVDKRFLLEQDSAVNLVTRYPNTWIQYINENGEPIYASREMVTGKPDIIVEEKVRNTWNFNKPKISNLDGYVKPEQVGKTIREIYDNSFVDYKKLIQPKYLNNDKPDINGASNLTFINPDNWVYQDEKQENGGEIDNGLYASDPLTLGSVATF